MTGLEIFALLFVAWLFKPESDSEKLASLQLKELEEKRRSCALAPKPPAAEQADEPWLQRGYGVATMPPDTLFGDELTGSFIDRW